MFDFAWSEILLIGAVALIAIGPKDMPAAIRTVSGMVKKARRMAAEFQTHVDEMVREADLGDVKKAFNDIRNLDLAERAGKARRSGPLDPQHLRGEPVRADLSRPRPRSRRWTRSTVSEKPAIEAAVNRSPAEPDKPIAPAFIPPAWCRRHRRRWRPNRKRPPAFIPPEAVLQRKAERGKN